MTPGSELTIPDRDEAGTLTLLGSSVLLADDLHEGADLVLGGASTATLRVADDGEFYGGNQGDDAQGSTVAVVSIDATLIVPSLAPLGGLDPRDFILNGLGGDLASLASKSRSLFDPGIEHGADSGHRDSGAGRDHAVGCCARRVWGAASSAAGQLLTTKPTAPRKRSRRTFPHRAITPVSTDGPRKPRDAALKPFNDSQQRLTDDAACQLGSVQTCQRSTDRLNVFAHRPELS